MCLERRECMHLLVEGRGKQEETMQEITVSRRDSGKNTKVPIGVVLERRTTWVISGACRWSATLQEGGYTRMEQL